jgi:hypothetical protein
LEDIVAMLYIFHYRKMLLFLLWAMTAVGWCVALYRMKVRVKIGKGYAGLTCKIVLLNRRSTSFDREENGNWMQEQNAIGSSWTVKVVEREKRKIGKAFI